METSLFKQWYLNQWVVDEDAKVYKFSNRNKAIELPRLLYGYHYVLGVDLGHSPDPSAFVVGAYHDEDPTLYIIHAEKHLKMDVTTVAMKIKELDLKFKFDAKVVDGSNKMAVEEMNTRHQSQLIAADKTGKNDFINLMNAEFIQGLIKLLPEAKELEQEYQSLVWVTDNGKVKEPRKEHPGIPNHLTDAGLYMWRYAYQYLHRKPIQGPAWGSQAQWEPKHMERLEQQVRIEKKPHSLELPPDQNLLEFDMDDSL
jgi:hypothetical protein